GSTARTKACAPQLPRSFLPFGPPTTAGASQRSVSLSGEAAVGADVPSRSRVAVVTGGPSFRSGRNRYGSTIPHGTPAGQGRHRTSDGPVLAVRRQWPSVVVLAEAE